MALALRPGYRALLQAFGTTVAFGMMLQPAIAADAPVQKIQVTGSAIKRINAEGSLPVQTLSASEIKKTGATSVAELIQALPTMQGFANAAGNVGAGNVGYASASVHGLGDDRTLVLLNGRRVAAFAGQTLIGASSGVNLNSIPLAAVERVEVLTDGASSIYGTDAIAGVVNFILKSDFSGITLDASMYQPEADGAEEVKASVTAGFGNLENNGYNIMGTLATQTSSSLRSVQRPEFAVPDKTKGYYTFTGTDGKSYRLRPSSSRPIPGNALIYWVNPSDPTDTVSRNINPRLLTDGKCGEWNVRNGNNCRYVYPSDLEIFPESEQISGSLSAQVKLGEKHTLFAEGLFSQHTMTTRIAPPPGEVPIAVGSQVFNDYILPWIGVGQPGNPGAGYVLDGNPDVAWRLTDAGRRTSKGTTDAMHFAGGLKGELAGWDYQTSLTYSENKWKEELLGGYLYNDDLAAAVASGLLNPFLDPGAQSAAGQAALDAAVAKGVWKQAKSKLMAVELRGSKELFSLPAGGLLGAFGVDYKKETDTYTPSLLAQGVERGGQFPDFATDVPFDVSRSSWGMFGEVVAPIVKSLEASASLRYDDYSDVGGTTNYKVAARWTPTSTLLFRGSVNSGFRAPRPAMTKNITQLYGVTANPYDCPYTDARAAGCPADGTQWQTYTGGSSELKPEESTQYTMGFRFEPVRWASVGADLWMVKIVDQYGTRTENEIAKDFEAAWAAGEIRPDLYRDPITGRAEHAFYRPLKNLGERKAIGLDYDFQFGTATPIGRLTSAFKGTWMMTDKQQTSKGGEFYQTVGTYSQEIGGSTLRHQFQWSFNLTTGDFDNRLTYNYRSGYEEMRDGNGTGDVFVDGGGLTEATYEVKPFTTLDYQGSWRTPLKGLTITGGILNVFNANPPFSINAGDGQVVGYNPQQADPRGRTYYLQAGYTFK